MLEMILSGVALMASYMFFLKTNIAAKLKVWKSLVVAILMIALSMYVFVLTGGRFYLIVILPTIVCAVLVTVNFQRYLLNIQKELAEKLAKREVL
ncbi:hypothetical protein [Lysinibacillus piscis]|uniref:Uncharacterized protein n=1 Tax=Lysinibacillus piscis TaxID=2518931 RepID=A0ABQ5NGB7_9BACI|nr:hypothetical protein [Lysinibacillus sp. KH24]GLC87308.1 hypothetical protein LYSBPC_04350 [Lysinibacillus sp. KH24]